MPRIDQPLEEISRRWIESEHARCIEMRGCFRCAIFRSMLLEEQVVVVQFTPGELFLICGSVSRHSNNVQVVTQAHRGACPCKPFNEISRGISLVDPQGDHTSLI